MEGREEAVESLLYWMGVMVVVAALPLEILCLANPLHLGKMEEMERVVVPPPLGTPP